MKPVGGFRRKTSRDMRRALALAERGRGDTRPNPVVGAVIVRGGRVLAEGYHHRVGEAHGEIDALAHLAGRAPGATIYVNLEPCCHTGRTGPCTEALLAAGIRRVVVGCLDPNPASTGAASRGCGAPASASTSAAWRPSAARPTAASSSGCARIGRWSR